MSRDVAGPTYTVACTAPRVLLVNHSGSDFTSDRLELALALKAAGYEVHAAVPSGELSDQGWSESIIVHRYRLNRTGRSIWAEAMTCLSLLHLYQRVRPSLVHHIGVKPSIYGGIAARIVGVPAAVSLFTGLGYLVSSESLRIAALRRLAWRVLAFGFAHKVHFAVFQHHDDRARLVDGGVVPPSRALVVRGSGVDTRRFKPSPEVEGPPVVLMAARLLWDKGVREFVGAARSIHRGGLPVRFLLAGAPEPGHPSSVPREQIERWAAERHIEWVGWQRDMEPLLACCHVACLPSYYGEGLPRFLLEAAASGRAIITTDVPGCRDCVTHGRSGLLVRPRDPEALASAIRDLLDDPARRIAMGAHARAEAVERSTIGRVIAANLAIYRRALAMRDPAPRSPRRRDPASLLPRTGRP